LAAPLPDALPPDELPREAPVVVRWPRGCFWLADVLFAFVDGFAWDFVADGDCMPDCGCAPGGAFMMSCAASGAAKASDDAVARIKASVLIWNLLIPLVGNNPLVE
jgi:hypothetical protein